MAKPQSSIDRAYIAAKRFFQYTLMGMRPSAAVGRINGPKVIMNSLPKSGTNLLNRALLYMPGLRQRGIRTIRLWGEADATLLSKLKKIRRGQYVVGHIQDSDTIFSLMQRERTRGLMMIRDPRMILLSHLSYVTNIDTTHRTHAYFASLPNNRERLDAIISGVDNVVAPIDEVLRRYERWMNHPDVLLIKFEDLIGTNGGGSDERQHFVIRNIVSHLGLTLNEVGVQRLAKNVFSSRVPTFRTARVDGWDRQFTNDQKELLKTKIGDWLIKYDYENDWHW